MVLVIVLITCLPTVAEMAIGGAGCIAIYGERIADSVRSSSLSLPYNFYLLSMDDIESHKNEE